MKHDAHCPESPTGAHHYDMSWPEPGVYQGVCRYCGHRRYEDANLGLGRDDARTRVCGRYAARQEMAETNGDTPEEETMVEIQIPKFKPGVQGNTAKGRFYGEHFDQIRSDLATLGKAETIRKWGMSEAWLYDHFVKGDPNVIRRNGRNTHRREPQPAQPVVTTNADRGDHVAHGIPDDGDGKFTNLPIASGPLPPWRNDWQPDVQIEWLRSARDIEVARIEAVKK